MDATFQRGDVLEYGASMRICPETTDTFKNVRKCFQTNGTAVAKIAPQSVLPDLTKFTVSFKLMVLWTTCVLFCVKHWIMSCDGHVPGV